MKFSKASPNAIGWWYWKGVVRGAVWLLNVYCNKRGVLMAEWLEDHKRGSSPVADLAGSYWARPVGLKLSPARP